MSILHNMTTLSQVLLTYSLECLSQATLYCPTYCLPEIFGAPLGEALVFLANIRLGRRGSPWTNTRTY